MRPRSMRGTVPTAYGACTSIREVDMRGARIGALVTIAMLAVVPLACSGDDDDDGGASNVSKSQFIDAADKVCGDFNKRVTDAAAPIAAENSSQTDVVNFLLDDALPMFRDEIEALRKLDTPAADADDLDQLWDDLDASTDEFEQKLKDDPDAALADDYDPFAAQNQFVEEYGFEECGA